MKSCFILPLSPVAVAIADISKIRGRIYELNRINVPAKYRGKRFGSELLKLVCAEADKQKVILRCYSMSSGPLSNEQLDEWYTRHGFIQGEGVYLHRFPKI